MISGRTVARFVKQHLLTPSVRHLSFATESTLLAIRDAEVKSTLRNVVDAASGRNVVGTGSLQVKKSIVMQMFQPRSKPVMTPSAQTVAFYGLLYRMSGQYERGSRIYLMSRTTRRNV